MKKEEKEILISAIDELRLYKAKFPDAEFNEAISYLWGIVIRPNPKSAPKKLKKKK